MVGLDVVGLGFASVDIILRVRKLSSVPKGGRILDYDKQGGGPASTAMVALSRLGAKSGIITKIGDDENGKFILSEFIKEKVDASRVVIEKDGKGPVVICLVEEGTAERVFLVYTKISDLRPEEIDFEYLKNAKILHLDGMRSQSVVGKAVEVAKENGLLVSLDMGGWSPSIANLVRGTDILIPTKRSALSATKQSDPFKAARKLKALGPKIVVITLGEEGSICIDEKNKILKHRGFNVSAVDTTGAGDVFHGAFLYGLIQKWELSRTLEFANAVAAMKCRKLGGRAAIPNLEEALIFLKERKEKD